MQQENMEPIRLQKYLTDCGVMSRRASEKEILAGHVSVNGIPASRGQKITPGEDTVTVRGKPVVPRPAGSGGDYTYILLNKPAGYVTTMSDDGGRKTVADLIRDVGTRVYPVGRLDLWSDGLLLCTDDGEVTNRLLHPSHEVPKQYLATLNDGEKNGAATKALLAEVEKVNEACPYRKDILDNKEYLSKKSVWIFGGDGWA